MIAMVVLYIRDRYPPGHCGDSRIHENLQIDKNDTWRLCFIE